MNAQLDVEILLRETKEKFESYVCHQMCTGCYPKPWEPPIVGLCGELVVCMNENHKHYYCDKCKAISDCPIHGRLAW